MSFTIIDIIAPSISSQIAPVNGALTSTRPKFTWAPSSDESTPVLYDLQVATNSAMISPVINKSNLIINNYSLIETEALVTGTYFWRARARDSYAIPNYSAWSSPPWSFTVAPLIKTATAALLSGWNMFSYPFIPEPTTNSGQLLDEISPLNVFHYNPAAGRYDTTDVATPGWGYWVKVASNTTIYTDGYPISNAYFEIPLGKGWNQVGFPFNSTIAWSAVQVKKDGITKSVQDAYVAGWINPWLYSYDPAYRNYIVRGIFDGLLKPFSGYWIKVKQDGVTLIIPSP